MELDWNNTHAAIWRKNKESLRPIQHIDPVRLDSLIGIEAQKNQLLANTKRFLANQPANNVLLWGARGTGKSSVIKALLNEYSPQGLRMIEVYKDDLRDLPEIVDDLRSRAFKFIIYCDDFSFEENENSYVAMKTILEGSIEQPPENVLLYATSNRRHLLPEYMKDNQGAEIINGELHYSDATEERISLSDRFGLWLSFYQPNIEGYLEIVDSYFPDYPGDRNELHRAAKQFAQLRASKSGRTARQFFNTYSDK